MSWLCYIYSVGKLTRHPLVLQRANGMIGSRLARPTATRTASQGPQISWDAWSMKQTVSAGLEYTLPYMQ